MGPFVNRSAARYCQCSTAHKRMEVPLQARQKSAAAGTPADRPRRMPYVHPKIFLDVQSVRHFHTHERVRTARDRVASVDLRVAHARPVHDHAGVLDLREDHSRRRQPAARRHRARRIRRDAIAAVYLLRMDFRQGRPQAGHCYRLADLCTGQLRRRVCARYDVDHRRTRDSGDGRGFVGG